MNNQNKKYTFHIHGMHCNSCVMMIENELKDLPDITKVKASLNNHHVELEGDFGNKTQEQIIEEISAILKPYGYSASLEKQIHFVNWKDFSVAIPIAIIFAFLFIFLQKIGIINFVQIEKVNYGTAFLIGIIASLSSCMAVVGGILLSMSATFAKNENKVKPQIMFHIGRIISFFIFGGIIGMVGSIFTLNVSTTFILNLIIGIVMLILGLNLLDIFSWIKKIQPSMPKFISKNIHKIKNINHTLTPLLIGIATFFLPCGFTQSMQIYTLTTGNFIQGALTMLAFAIGTLPILMLISFSSFSIKNNSKSGIFFKSAGLIVIMFALFNLINSLVVIGFIPPIFNF